MDTSGPPTSLDTQVNVRVRRDERAGEQVGERERDLVVDHAVDPQRPVRGRERGDAQRGVDPVEVRVGRDHRGRAERGEVRAGRYRRSGRDRGGGEQPGHLGAGVADPAAEQLACPARDDRGGTDDAERGGAVEDTAARDGTLIATSAGVGIIRAARARGCRFVVGGGVAERVRRGRGRPEQPRVKPPDRPHPGGRRHDLREQVELGERRCRPRRGAGHEPERDDDRDGRPRRPARGEPGECGHAGEQDADPGSSTGLSAVPNVAVANSTSGSGASRTTAAATASGGDAGRGDERRGEVPGSDGEGDRRDAQPRRDPARDP